MSSAGAAGHQSVSMSSLADRDGASVRRAITGTDAVAFRPPVGLKGSKNPFRSS